ncbi:MAG: HEAT repeat domain-containing protein [Armatimonadetes bacterium]|nr:HEAT repeat domain-containing protein [Armatimonadota bacterium]MDW8122620.1 HEAT repeat domain-containing protein [Armatimonadota bacterium]
MRGRIKIKGKPFYGPIGSVLLTIGLVLTFAVAVVDSERGKGDGTEPRTSPTLPPSAKRILLADGEARLWTVHPEGITINARLDENRDDRLYSLTVRAIKPLTLGNGTIVLSGEGKQRLFQKTLHSADPDLYVVFRAPSRKTIRLVFRTKGIVSPVLFKIRLGGLPHNPEEAVIEAEPNDSPEQAQTIFLGVPVVGTADDRPYFIAPSDNENDALSAGVDWFRLEQPDKEPKLVFFNLDILDRDVPANVTVYTLEKGELVPYVDGYDPVSGPHEAQVGPVIRQAGVELNSANKFTTRVLKQGTYFVKVEANHPAYRLRTTAYPVPPYEDPEKAITVAMNYLVAAGDSWFANTPRSGAIPRRDQQVHLETIVCTACHPSQFSTRGTLWAYKNGYPVSEREALRFLADRIRNAPRPFYLDGTVWVRFIGASAHVLSQMALIQDLYETVANESLPHYFTANAAYVRAFYQRDHLPFSGTGNDEQNPPTLSTFETAWMALRLFKKIGDRESFDKVKGLAVNAPSDRVQTADDLAWQTILFAEVDPSGLSQRIQENVARLLKLQREDGSWAYRMDDKSPSSEFSTATVLFALARAGLTADHPQVAKGVRFLLSRQKSFGGWNTDGQPYEAFNTPFKETQLSLMALSELYRKKSQRGWGTSQQIGSIRTSSLSATLRDLMAIWDHPGEAVVQKIRRLSQHPEPLIRWEALNALCRLADGTSVPMFESSLEDDTLMVRRSAAQALREVYSRRLGTKEAKQALEATVHALENADPTVRRAGLRVINQHFRWLATETELLQRVLRIARSDPDPVARLQAVQSLPQFWVWNPSFAARSRILDAILAGLADSGNTESVLWALREALYSIYDEDVQYVYAFWVPLLPKEEDRQSALSYFERLMALQALKVAQALDKGSDFLKKQVLTALTEFPIVRSWNPDDQIERNFYRIGNDLDAIDFRGRSADILEPVIIKLLNDSDPFVRERALVVSSYLRSSGARPALANNIVRLLTDPNPTIRKLAVQAHRLFPFNDRHVQYGIDPRRYPDQPNHDSTTRDLLLTLLEGASDGLAPLILPVLAEVPSWFDGDPRVRSRLVTLIREGQPSTQAAALDLLRHLPSFHGDPEIHQLVARVLESGSLDAGLSAARLALIAQPIGHSEPVSTVLDRFLQTDDPTAIGRLLALASSDAAIRDDVRWVPLLEKALTLDGDIRSRAISLIRQSKTHATNPSVRMVLSSLAQSQDGADAAAIRQILDGNRSGASQDPEKSLDFEYFAVRIQPLLAAPAGDGRSCFSCHANQSVLNLKPPDATGYFPNEVSRHNYRSALRVVNLDQPEESLILKKPTMEAPHCGGKRWDSRDHPAYQAILMWLNGAKVKQGEALGKYPE